jgi:hypothetical protein
LRIFGIYLCTLRTGRENIDCAPEFCKHRLSNLRLKIRRKYGL